MRSGRDRADSGGLDPTIGIQTTDQGPRTERLRAANTPFSASLGQHYAIVVARTLPQVVAALKGAPRAGRQARSDPEFLAEAKARKLDVNPMPGDALVDDFHRTPANVVAQARPVIVERAR